jgi:hypothetical protein
MKWIVAGFLIADDGREYVEEDVIEATSAEDAVAIWCDVHYDESRESPFAVVEV